MRLDYPSFLVTQYSPRSVALHPGVLSEHEAVQLFTEVLNHVVTFRLAVDEEVKADFLLELDDHLNLLLDELIVFSLGDLALAELGTGRTDFFGLGERTDGSGGELGQVEVLGLDFLASGERTLAVVHVRGNGSDTLANSVVRSGLKLATLGNGDLVGLKSSRDLGVLRARENSCDGGNLGRLLKGEREPVPLLLGELLLRCKSDRGVQERRRGSNNDTVSTESSDGSLCKLDGSCKVCFPDVTSRNNTKRKYDGSGLYGSNNLAELLGCTDEINVEASNGELGDKVDVGVQAVEVGGEHDLGSDRDKLSVSKRILLVEFGTLVENKDRLINLDGFNSSSLELRQELLVNRQDLGEQRDGLEGSRCFLGSLGKDEIRDGAENDWASDDAGLLGLLVLSKGLVVEELEVGLLGQLWNDKVVVGVEPETSKYQQHHLGTVKLRHVPFLHFRSGDIDTASLTTTTHSEENIEGREPKTLVTLRDGVECRRVVENVVIEREFSAMNRIIRSIDAVDLEGNANLGIKSTPRSLRLVQLDFLTSEAALIKSSAESLPAQ
jgi:hypothetical protein